MANHFGGLTREQRAEARAKVERIKSHAISVFTEKNPKYLDQYFKWVPDNLKLKWLKSKAKVLSPKEAIKMKCMECCAYQREEVYRCTGYSCPLHAYRPMPPGMEAEKLDIPFNDPAEETQNNFLK